MKTVILILLVLLAAGVIAYLLLYPPPSPSPTFSSTGPTLVGLQDLSDLVTTRIHVADVLVAEDPKFRAFWLIKGDALLSVDMTRAEILHKDEQTRYALIQLPPPVVIQARVDHDKTRIWDMQRKTWNPFKAGDPDVLRDQAMQQAQKLIAFAAAEDEPIQHARAVAETAIPAFFRMVDWDVRVAWSDRSASLPAEPSGDLPATPPTPN